MLGRIVVLGALAALLGACSMETRTIAANDTCMGYGLSVGTAAYEKCRAGDGRSGSATTPAQLMTASRSACQSYGIAPYTAHFERCVQNEYAYRVDG